MLSRHSVGTYQENELTLNSSGNARPQSSQLAEPLLTDLFLKSEIVVREITSTFKKSAVGDCQTSPSPKTLVCKGKATTTTTV